jgi:hypothetical protein
LVIGRDDDNINAVKEQQAQIESQRSQIETLPTANATLNWRLRNKVGSSQRRR